MGEEGIHAENAGLGQVGRPAERLWQQEIEGRQTVIYKRGAKYWVKFQHGGKMIYKLTGRRVPLKRDR